MYKIYVKGAKKLCCDCATILGLGSTPAPICVVSEYLPKSRPKYYRSPYCNSNHDGYNPTHSLGYKS